MKNSFLEESKFTDTKFRETQFEGYNTDNNFEQNLPGPVFATNGSLHGEIFLQWDAIKNALKYVVALSSGKTTKWVQVDIVKDPLYCITGLKPGREYSFRVAAIFPEGVGPWSEAVTKKVK